MCILRALIVAVLLAGGPAVVLAQSRPPLANIDRELNALCARLDGASGSGAAAIRSRLAVLWRQRVAYFESIPPNRRLAEQRLGIATAQCLTMAKAAAEPQQVVAPRTGGGGAGRRHGYSAPRQPPPPAPPPMANGGPRAPGPTAAPQPPRPTPREPAAAELEEFFPWPPPAPSDRTLLGLNQLSGGAAAATWGDVADQILALLKRAQFTRQGFYSAPGGFAVVTQIEQLDDQSGAALAGDDRWASETKVASTNILQGIFTVRRPKGLYRVFCFVLTTDPRSGGPVTDPTRMLQLARRWALSGAADLPDALRSQPIVSAHRLFVLVYEFESAVGGETAVNSPGRWTFARHFKDAGMTLPP